MKYCDYRVGDLLLLNSGGVAFLRERFSPYAEERRRRGLPEEQLRYGDSMAWRLTFLNGDPNDRVPGIYNEKWGWSETNLGNGAYGRVLETPDG